MSNDNILSKFRPKYKPNEIFEGFKPDKISIEVQALLEIVLKDFIPFEENARNVILKRLNDKCRLLDIVLPYSINNIKNFRDRYGNLILKLISEEAANISVDLGAHVNNRIAKYFLWKTIGTTQLSESNRFTEDFICHEPLDKGAYGTVFKVRHRLDNRYYAIKKINLNPNDPLSAVNALREVRQLSSLHHENIVSYNTAWLEFLSDKPPQFSKQISQDVSMQESCTSSSSTNNSIVFENSNCTNEKMKLESQHQLDICNKNNISLNKNYGRKLHMNLCIQMELCKTTLKNWIAKRNDDRKDNTLLTGKIELSIFKQLLVALSYTHQHGIMHRDIKPKNIFISKTGYENNKLLVKLGDFGLAREVLDDEPCSPLVKSSCGFTESVGTTLYAAPEQLTSKLYDMKVDMYSLGLILIELFCIFKTDMEKIKCLLNAREKEILLPKEFCMNFPEISYYTRQLLNHDSTKRPSANELLSIFDSCLCVKKTMQISDIVIKETDAAIHESELDYYKRVIQEQKKIIEFYQKNCVCGIQK